MTSILATLVVGLAPVQGDSASSIVSKVLQHYADAKSISGTVTLRQRAMNQEAKIETFMQFDRPDRVFMRQIRHAGPATPAQTFILQTDGKTFTYSAPPGVFSKKGVVTEAVVQDGRQLQIRDMYTPFRQAVEDPNILIELAFARKDDLRAILDSWATMAVHSKVKIGEQDVTAIVGNLSGSKGSGGNYELYVNDSYDVVRYVVKQYFKAPPVLDNNGNLVKPPTDQPIEVTSIWDSSLKVNGTTDPALYKG